MPRTQLGLRIAAAAMAGAAIAGSAAWFGASRGEAADSTPADKVTVAGGDVDVIGPGQRTTLMQATMRTSAVEDLVFQVTAECALVTNLVTVGNDSSSAFGQVRIWVEVDGKAVPIVSAPGQPNTAPSGADSGRVVFCNRAFSSTTSGFAADQPTIKTFLATREANAFNWAAFNVGNGIHTLTVLGELTQTATNGSASAVVGNRTLVVQPTTMAQNQTPGGGGTTAATTASGGSAAPLAAPSAGSAPGTGGAPAVQQVVSILLRTL